MEKRAILAAILMAVVLFAYMWVQETYFAAPRPPGQQVSEPSKAPAPPTPPVPQEQAKPLAPIPAPPMARRAESARQPEKTITVDAPLYRGAVSSEGGKLTDWTLRYRGEKPMVVPGESGPTGLIVADDPASTQPLTMAIASGPLRLDPTNPVGELTLSGDASGLKVLKKLTFKADSYAVEAVIQIENPTQAPRAVAVTLPWVFHLPAKPISEKFLGQRPTEVVWSTGGHIDRVEDLHAIGSQVIDGAWVALDSTWYISAVVPRTPGFKLIAAGAEKKSDAKNGVETHVSIAARAMPTIPPGRVWEGQVVMYVGPKEYDRLVMWGLEGSLNFGGFPLPRKYGGLPMEWLGVPILRLMNWMHRYVGNYGVVIILLTVLSKVLFYPLTVKSMRSMKAMQALQPQVNALRSKYKNDPRKLQEETLTLYRKYKVNPMGGCLPMVAQVPIFYALYLALSVSVELQNAPFLCFGRIPDGVPGIGGSSVWICDLANPDPTYVLPLLMGITMFVQQKMTPVAGDPRQAKMMLVMPFIFTWMFFNLASGLVLYWTMSNVLQIAQQWWMDRSRRSSTREAKDVAGA